MKRQGNATGLPGPRAVYARLPFFQHNKTFPADRCSFARPSILRTLYSTSSTEQLYPVFTPVNFQSAFLGAHH